MSQSKKHRKWTAARKLQLVLESLSSDSKAAEICRREGLSPTQLYSWRKGLQASAEQVFARKKAGRGGGDPKVEKLEAENARMKSVIAEVIAENLELKKTLSV
jgi:transposase-like protein